jgi:hypothetical protein
VPEAVPARASPTAFVAGSDLDVWTAPGGARVAWFPDPDGNTLSLQEDP